MFPSHDLSGTTTINVTQYDNGGTLTTLTNNRFKILTVYKFGSGNHVVQEGQAQYSSLDEAQAAIATRTFVPNPAVANGTRLGWIIVQKNATDLTDTNTSRFIVDSGSFNTSTATVGALLASNNLSDLADPATARTNIGLGTTDDVVFNTVDGRDIATDGTKLDGIETGADVTDEANVTSALDGATLTAATVAGTDKVLVQDADDSDNLKTVTAQSIADLGGGGVEFYESSQQTLTAGGSLTLTHGLSSKPKAVELVLYVSRLDHCTKERYRSN